MIKDYWEGVKMKKKSIPELDKLFQEIGTYKKTTEFKELLDFVKKFPKIAPFNAMLLHTQKPGSNYVATAAEWQKNSEDVLNLKQDLWLY